MIFPNMLTYLYPVFGGVGTTWVIKLALPLAVLIGLDRASHATVVAFVANPRCAGAEPTGDGEGYRHQGNDGKCDSTLQLNPFSLTPLPRA